MSGIMALGRVNLSRTWIKIAARYMRREKMN